MIANDEFPMAVHDAISATTEEAYDSAMATLSPELQEAVITVRDMKDGKIPADEILEIIQATEDERDRLKQQYGVDHG